MDAYKEKPSLYGKLRTVGNYAHSFGTTQYPVRSMFALDMKDLFIEELFTFLFTAVLVIELRFVSSMMCSSWYNRRLEQQSTVSADSASTPLIRPC